MRRKIADAYKRLSLVSRIRLSYIIPFVPIVILIVFTYSNLYISNRQYSDMIGSVVKASAFSLDFKHDFDYETYMVVVGQREEKESKLLEMIREARQVVDDLDQLTKTGENKERLESIVKYLDNLETYVDRINKNIGRPGTYDENMQIWENDVQVGTSLLQEAFYQYIYYEVKDLDSEREGQQAFLTRTVSISIGAAGIVVVLIIMITWYFNRLLRQVQQEQIQLRKTEFLVLQSQINPHFLYNTLDAITWLAESGEQEAVVKMVGSLSEFFRTSLNSGKDIVTVSEDVHHIRSYLAIQKVRYQDILEYEVDVPDIYGAVLIPKLTLQPLVENALYHGIKNKRGGGHIRIVAEREEEDLIIRISDDGVGMNEDRLCQVREGISEKAPEEKGIYGLYNVNERIRLHFGERYGITIESQEGTGTVTTVRLPLS
ncbi:MAG: sensor histidine kinase [Eubacterium sp.]|nr:sensor histidine kinase [Eubacterium sp.]